MGRIIGIDLGTTYSAMAIPEERPPAGGFLTIRECPGCSIILDRFKNHITPSVVAENDRGEIIVGHPAKSRAGFSPAPIMFAKRSMGEDATFPVGKHGLLTPAQVSGHLLKYLKELAEFRLGEPVEEGVITVPAYFSLAAKQMTEEAAKLAGLRVAQIALEPVAAALMYCVGDPRDPLTIMTYDLGGGTFDVAVLEKRGGVISTDSIRAFDGDRFLGGYDFDRLLAFWLADELVGRGYDLRLNVDHPRDKVIFAKLMVYAERAKIALSKQEVYELQEPATGIEDHSGVPVAFDLTVTRDQFVAMIGDKVERTVDLCQRVLAKAFPDVAPGDRARRIDEIVMVGGSSRIPFISRRIEATFGRVPRLVNPDLCVALGAAIIASGAGRTLGLLRLDPVPAETDLLEIAVTGQVLPSAEPLDRCTVTLRAADGSYLRARAPGAEGRFSFARVPLAPGARTEFELSLVSSGVQAGAHAFVVSQQRTPASGGSVLVEPVPNVLSKPIGVLLSGGLHTVAPERTPLPFETVVHARTRDNSGIIRIAIQEENNPLGEIFMTDIPTSLPVGTAVEITLTIREDFQILGRGYVPALQREETVAISIPVRPQKTIAELSAEFDLLSDRANDSLAAAGRGAAFSKAKQLRDRLGQCKRMLDEASRGRGGEPGAIQDCLDEIETLCQNLTKRWTPEPPRLAFDEKFEEALQSLEEARRQSPKIAGEGFDKQLEAIRSEADKAYREQNSTSWKDCYDKVEAICQKIGRQARPGGNTTPPPDPAQLVLMLAQELTRLERWAKEHGHYDHYRQDFEALAAALKKINPKSPDAMNEIRDWYMTRYQDLKSRMEAPQTLGIPELDRQNRGGGR